MDFQCLTVHAYSEDPKEERRVTLSPIQIVLVAAELEDIQLNGRSLRPVSILFSDGNSVDLTINHGDLQLLESAVGSFCFG